MNCLYLSTLSFTHPMSQSQPLPHPVYHPLSLSHHHVEVVPPPPSPLTMLRSSLPVPHGPFLTMFRSSLSRTSRRTWPTSSWRCGSSSAEAACWSLHSCVHTVSGLSVTCRRTRRVRQLEAEVSAGPSQGRQWFSSVADLPSAPRSSIVHSECA